MNVSRIAALLRQLADELECDAEPGPKRRERPTRVTVTEEHRATALAALKRAGVDLERR